MQARLTERRGWSTTRPRCSSVHAPGRSAERERQLGEDLALGAATARRAAGRPPAGELEQEKGSPAAADRGTRLATRRAVAGAGARRGRPRRRRGEPRQALTGLAEAEARPEPWLGRASRASTTGRRHDGLQAPSLRALGGPTTARCSGAGGCRGDRRQAAGGRAGDPGGGYAAAPASWTAAIALARTEVAGFAEQREASAEALAAQEAALAGRRPRACGRDRAPQRCRLRRGLARLAERGQHLARRQDSLAGELAKGRAGGRPRRPRGRPRRCWPARESAGAGRARARGRPGGLRGRAGGGPGGTITRLGGLEAELRAVLPLVADLDRRSVRAASGSPRTAAPGGGCGAG